MHCALCKEDAPPTTWLHMKQDARTAGKCDAPTVQRCGGDAHTFALPHVLLPLHLYTVGVSGVSGAKKRKGTRASHQP